MSLRVSPSLNYLFPARQREERPDLPGNDTHPTAGMSQEQLLQKPSGLLLTFPCPLIPGRATLLNSGTSQSLGPLSSFPRSSLARQQPVSSCFTSLGGFAPIVCSSVVPPAGSVLHGVVRDVEPQQLAEQGVLSGCYQGCGGSGEPGTDEK